MEQLANVGAAAAHALEPDPCNQAVRIGDVDRASVEKNATPMLAKVREVSSQNLIEVAMFSVAESQKTHSSIVSLVVVCGPGTGYSGERTL
jgi:hypothetical protein